MSRLSRNDIRSLTKIASVGFSLFTLVQTAKTARRDDDGLQFAEALVRGVALALSTAILVRELRSSRAERLLSEEPPAGQTLV
jgi:hypothetical protein